MENFNTVPSQGKFGDSVAVVNENFLLAQQEMEILRNLISPDTKFVTAVATAQTTSVTQVLPATGSTDTVYRVGKWDGTQYDATVYSEYGWFGSQYKLLATKEYGIDTTPTAGSENLITSGAVAASIVYDISAAHSGAVYADLAAALGTNGSNVPDPVRKGGMSVKFIQGTVQSSDNKYVQYFLTKDEWSVSEADWEKMNLEEEINQLGQKALNDIGIGNKLSFIGDGNTLIGNNGENPLYGVNPGEKYRLFIVNPDVDMTGVTLPAPSSRFAIWSMDSNSNPTLLMSIPIGQSLNDYYDITIPTGAVAIFISGRCAVGAILKTYVQKITNELLVDSLPGEEIRNWEDGYYIPTLSVGDTIDLTNKQPDGQWQCNVINCAAGDSFIINNHCAGNPARAWAFIDSENKVLSLSETGEILNSVITAPANTAKVVFNNNKKYTGNWLTYYYCFINQINPDYLKSFATKDDVKNAKDELYSELIGSIDTPIDEWTEGYYIPTLSVGDTLNLNNLIAQGEYESKVLSCVAGDKFLVNNKFGGGSARAVCFIDANNVVLEQSEPGVVISNQIFTAPLNTAKVVFNNNKKGTDSWGIYYSHLADQLKEKYIKKYATKESVEKASYKNLVVDVLRSGEITNWENGYYIQTLSVGQTIDLNNKVVNNEFQVAVVDCSPGDLFEINNHFGGGTARAWAFIDSNNVVLSISDTGEIINEIITTPANATKVVFNNNKNSTGNWLKYYNVFANQIKPQYLESFATKDYVENAIAGVQGNVVDLLMFMGQSNIAGRGETNAQHTEGFPLIIENAGYEFRAISDPTKLYPIAEPFGVAENKTGGINDGSMKTGSPVTAFVNAYYKQSGVPVIAVSASKGGTTISQWQSNGILLPDAIQRFNDAVQYLTLNGYTIRHKYMVWLQGEGDGDNGTSKNDYKTSFASMFSSMQNAGIEKCLLIRIGKRSYDERYSDIISAQTEICQENDNIIMISTALSDFRRLGYMKDNFHYYQDGYNRIGNIAGHNAGIYARYGIERMQYDSEASDNMYLSYKCN